MSDNADVAGLRAANARLEDELALLRGVLTLVKEDLHVKDEQIEYLYQSFLASQAHKRQEKERLERRRRWAEGLDGTVAIASTTASPTSTSTTTKTAATARSTTRQPDAGVAPWSDLPGVLVIHIVRFLDCRSILSTAATHPQWHSTIMRHDVWSDLYLVRWRDADRRRGPERVRMFATKYVHDFAEHGLDNVRRDALWMDLYRERHSVERNWAAGKATVTTLNGHSGTVTCLSFQDSTLVSGSDDGSMMLWSLSPRDDDNNDFVDPGPCLMQQHHRQIRSVEKRHSFHGHGGPIWALHFTDGCLLSGSYDKTVKVWDLWSGKCVGTLRGHTGWVSSVDSYRDLIASASWDSTINIWSKQTGALLRTLNDDLVNPIYALTWDDPGNMFVVGRRRSGVQLWDVETGRKVSNYIGHDANNQVNAIKTCRDRIVSGGSDHTVKVWDRRQAACSNTLVGHRGAVMCVDYDNDHLVTSGSYDAIIKLWDLRRPSAPISAIEGHSSAVFSLQTDASKLISGSADTTIKIFRF